MLTIGLYGIPDRRGLHEAHDHAVAVMREGRVLTCIELERVTGRKHDNRLDRYFDELIAPWLESGETVRFVQANSFLGGRFATVSGSLTIEHPAEVPLEATLAPSTCRLGPPYKGLDAAAFTLSHELAHIGSCLPFHGPPPAGSLLVHVDGGASSSACSAWFWDGGRLECLHSSWNELKVAVNNFNDNPLAAQILGLDLTQHLSMPGKLMGLAGFGAPRDDVLAWLEDHGFFLGPRWRAEDLLPRISQAFGPTPTDDPTRVRLHQDVATCLQRHFEESLLGYLQRWKESTGASHLYYAGGAALNIVANARIEDELGFDTLSIPPAPSDCGLALGAAAIAEWLDGRPIEKTTPYLTGLAPAEHGGLERPTAARSAAQVARDLASGAVVASITGAAEVGPRALGHRSLLARPDSVALRRRLSEGMKQREWYRPVAPVMLPEVAAACLQDYRADSSLGTYMLGSWSVSPEHRACFAGCLHADGTVRAQVVEPACPAQARLTELLHVLLRDHGIHGLINTSLNARGEPIQQSMKSAVRQAALVGADQLWIDHADSPSSGTGSQSAGKSPPLFAENLCLP